VEGEADVAGVVGITATTLPAETPNNNNNSTSGCPPRTLISRAAMRDSTKPPLGRRPPAKRHQKAVPLPMTLRPPLVLDQGHRALRRRRRSRRRITRKSRSLTRCLRLLLRRLVLGLGRALGRVARRVVVAVVAVVGVEEEEVGVIDAKRRERRMWLRSASRVGWGFLVLVDMSADGEDMVGGVAGRDVVEVVVAGVEEAVVVEVRRPLFKLVYEGFLYNSKFVMVLGERRRTLSRGKMFMEMR